MPEVLPYYNIQVFNVSAAFKEKALKWASTHKICSFYTSNSIPYPYGAFKEILAVGSEKELLSEQDPFRDLHDLHQQEPDWRMGYLTYELKNAIHGLSCKNPSTITFPASGFYRPACLIHFFHDQVEILSHLLKPADVWEQINSFESPIPSPISGIKLTPHMSANEYVQKVNLIKEHILDGDCYELNFCQEFSSANVDLDPLTAFLRLNEISPAPFASFQKFDEQYLVCASPERFLKKEGNKLTSQPIKGTIKRGATPAEDEFLKEHLRNDEKERAENMMIVDLVRNDLARSSIPGSVKVDEIFGIYSFQQVHQMISTISSTVHSGIPFTDAIRNAYPMGSMTGAPKRKVMELIEKYENSSRGIYSGSVGYISPEGDFDFNVVIRSLVYDAGTKKLSFQVGSAITYDSDPEREYDECLLKAKALMEILGNQMF